MDYSKLSYITRKYWKPAYCDEIECAIVHDGLLFMFDIEDVKEILKQYPEDKEGWFFNRTKDRYIAEKVGEGRVTVNPQFCYQNFTEILT